MTVSPPTLVKLGAYWKHQGGKNLGVVGDASHKAKGISYHLGRAELQSDAYSRNAKRDRVGLSDAASAIDLGRLDGSLHKLRQFSNWLVDRAQHNAPGTRDIREIIWSPDGKRVLRWDRERGADSKPRLGEADDSHLTHTHVSFYRDAELRDHTVAFRPFFEKAKGDDVPRLTRYVPGSVATIKVTSNVRKAPAMDADIIRVLEVPEDWVVTGWVKGDKDPEGGSDAWLTRWSGGRWEYTAKANVIAGPSAPPALDCHAAVVAATAPLEAQIVALNAQIAAEKGNG